MESGKVQRRMANHSAGVRGPPPLSAGCCWLWSDNQAALCRWLRCQSACHMLVLIHCQSPGADSPQISAQTSFPRDVYPHSEAGFNPRRSLSKLGCHFPQITHI